MCYTKLIHPKHAELEEIILSAKESYNKSSICKEADTSTFQYHKIRTVVSNMYLD